MAMRSWQVESVRLTIFTTAAPVQENLGWWKSVAGSEPEAIVSKPAQAVYSANGIVSDVSFILNIASGRIDWLVAGAPNEDTPIPVIGEYAKAKSKFDELLKPWLARKPVPVSRLALGIVARLSAENKVDAYRGIAKFLPAVKIDAENSAELTYQINRPRKSRVMNGLTINRLTKWSILTFATAAISIAGGPTVRTPIATFGHLEVDINTDVENTSDLTAYSDELLGEFFEQGEEIMEKGDIA